MTSKFRLILNAVLLTATGIFIYLLWMYALSRGAELSGTVQFGLYSQFFQHLTGLVTLLIIAIPYCLFVKPLPVGHFQARQTALFALAMLALYLGVALTEKVMHIPDEPYVKMMLSLPVFPLSAFVFTVVVLAPLSEEIVFRGVLLNIFISRHAWTGYAGAVLLAVIFSMMHGQYKHLSTFVELFGVALLLSLARLRSGGLLLPVLLHAEASVIALVLNL
ncbi:CPBP family intramembrane glutamic endopeptidase [Erwinia amylovora]|uniref:CPBP family intramembrane glutamic endopeptidase n=2 Tax=Erwinia amylovora TaxID=552 RepID=UPI001F034459|nr:CPBP family intramembrane glutamic endopeptidase [Erwinia amylovora]